MVIMCKYMNYFDKHVWEKTVHGRFAYGPLTQEFFLWKKNCQNLAVNMGPRDSTLSTRYISVLHARQRTYILLLNNELVVQ